MRSSSSYRKPQVSKGRPKGSKNLEKKAYTTINRQRTIRFKVLTHNDLSEETLSPETELPGASHLSQKADITDGLEADKSTIFEHQASKKQLPDCDLDRSGQDSGHGSSTVEHRRVRSDLDGGHGGAMPSLESTSWYQARVESNMQYSAPLLSDTPSANVDSQPHFDLDAGFQRTQMSGVESNMFSNSWSSSESGYNSPSGWWPLLTPGLYYSQHTPVSTYSP